MKKMVETLMLENRERERERERESEKNIEEVRIKLNKERAQRIRDAREEREHIGLIKERLD